MNKVIICYNINEVDLFNLI